MENHYYTNDKALPHHRRTWSYSLGGFDFKFTSDNGVFSKNSIDFGSKLLIETAKSNLNNGNFLDMGCGYGPIGIAVAKFYPKSNVTMIDVNLRALELAKENVALNNIHNVDIFESFIYEKVKTKDYQAILSNPPIRAGKKVVHKILEESVEYLAEKGELWIVIQKKQGASSAKKKMEEVFGNCKVESREKGYFILKSIKNI